MSDLTDLEEELDEIADLQFLLGDDKPRGCCLFSLLLLLAPAALVAVTVGMIAKLLL